MATQPAAFPLVFDFCFRGFATRISFDGIELKNPEPFTKSRRVLINSADLVSGKQSIQASTETALAVSFRCSSGDYYDVSNLYAKIGTKADLIIDEYTYAGCYISSFRERKWFPGEWEYEVSFLQETV